MKDETYNNKGTRKQLYRALLWPTTLLGLGLRAPALLA